MGHQISSEAPIAGLSANFTRRYNAKSFQIFRNAKELARLDVDSPSPSPDPRVESTEITPFTPEPSATGRISGDFTGSVLFKRSRLSGDGLTYSPYDPFTDSGERATKRRKGDWRGVGSWSLTSRAPSPEKKGDERDSDDATASSEEVVLKTAPVIPPPASKSSELTVGKRITTRSMDRRQSPPPQTEPKKPQAAVPVYEISSDESDDDEPQTDQAEQETEEREDRIHLEASAAVLPITDQSRITVYRDHAEPEAQPDLFPGPHLMPPPAFPHTRTEKTRSPLQQAVTANLEIPKSPELQPVPSDTLPLPSPFPEIANEASDSYIDSRPREEQSTPTRNSASPAAVRASPGDDTALQIPLTKDRKKRASSASSYKSENGPFGEHFRARAPFGLDGADATALEEAVIDGSQHQHVPAHEVVPSSGFDVSAEAAPPVEGPALASTRRAESELLPGNLESVQSVPFNRRIQDWVETPAGVAHRDTLDGDAYERDTEFRKDELAKSLFEMGAVTHPAFAGDAPSQEVSYPKLPPAALNATQESTTDLLSQMEPSEGNFEGRQNVADPSASQESSTVKYPQLPNVPELLSLPDPVLSSSLPGPSQAEEALRVGSHGLMTPSATQSSPVRPLIRGLKQNDMPLPLSPTLTQQELGSQPTQSSQTAILHSPSDSSKKSVDSGHTSNKSVPDAISPWFSPSRASIRAAEVLTAPVYTSLQEKQAIIEEAEEETEEVRTTSSYGSRTDLLVEAKAKLLEMTQKTIQESKEELHEEAKSDHKTNGAVVSSHGLRTSLSYYTPLHPQRLRPLLNVSSSQTSPDNSIDVIAVVSSPPKRPTRAEKGPRDWNTVLSISDPSSWAQKDAEESEWPRGEIQVQCFMGGKNGGELLPRAQVGDIILLTDFRVNSRNGKVSLINKGPGSGWCVWKFSELATEAQASKPIWAQNGKLNGQHRDDSPATEMRGAPVEFGEEEQAHVMKLRHWWEENSSKSIKKDE